MYYTLQVTLLLYVFTARFHVAVSQDTGPGQENNATVSGSGQENNATVSEPPHDLYLLTIGPYPDPILKPGWDRGPALIPAVRLAVEHINKRRDILEGFSLKLLEGDSGCNLESKSIITYVKNVFYSGKQVVGIIGPACSAATLALAKIVSLNNATSLIVQSPGASSPLLNNVEYFNTFRTIGSSLAYVDTFLTIIRLNSWKRIACLYDEERIYFRSTFSVFSERASEAGLRVFSSAMYDGEDLQLFPVQEIIKEEVRVVFVFAGAQTCRRLLCIAYNMNVLFPTYQWIFHDRSKSQLISNETFWYNGENFSCNETIMKLASHGAILNTQRTKREDDDETITVSGLNLTQYEEVYEQKRIEYQNEIGLENITTSFANLYYDAAWSFALSLNSSVPILRENGFSLVNYTYGQPAATEIIRQEFFNVQFEGISGPIMFNNETRDSETIIDISQLWKNDTTVEVIEIGYYYGNITMINQAMFINDTFDKEPVKIHLGVGVIVIFATMLSTTFTALLQLANLVWYHKRSIKASSPNLSHLISSGCYLFAIAALAYSIQETFNFPTSTNSVAYATLCNTFTWCLVLGYSLVFGTVCAKMWRVYKIFRHFRNESPGALLSDNALIVFVIILLFLDMIVCTVWNVSDPWLLETSEVFNEHQGEIDDLPTISIYSSCSCKNLYVWLGILVAYKGIIALVVIVLSIANRHIKRKEFKHAKKVNMLVYSLALIWGAGMPLHFILESFNLHIKFLIMCAMLNVAILLCCALLFLPPVIPVLKQNRNISKDFARKLSVISFFSGE